MKHPIQVFNFDFKNVNDDTLEIYIDGEIVDAATQEILKAWFGDETSVSYKSFRNSISDTKAHTINVIVNSPGGHVGDAMAIYDLLQDLQTKGKTVNTKGIGIVASAATYLVMAGNSEMSKNSWFMIHNAAGGVWGDVHTIGNYYNTLKKFNDRIRDFYANATGKRKEDITKMMDNETWMTAEEAKENGFIKQVTGEVAFKNAIPKDQWQYSNTAVLNAYNSSVRPNSNEGSSQSDHTFLQTQFDQMKNWIKNALGIKDTQLPENADQQAILNAVVDGLIPHLEKLDEEVQAEINNQVTEALKGDAFKNAVTVAANELFEQRVKNLETKSAELESDVTNKLGTPTSIANSNEEKPKLIGKYVEN